MRILTRYLHSADVLVIGFFAMLSLINIAFASRIPYWWHLVLINGVITTGIWALAYARHATDWKILRVLHDWHVAPTVFFSFKELYFMIKPIHLGRDYDDVLISIDHWLFGVNPTEWLLQFSHPLLTEVLQIAYTAFYLLFIIVGYELYRRGEKEAFRFFLFTCVYGFYLSYLGYFLLPAVGPRFTLHDFAALDKELPGLWLTPVLRWFVNAGESIPTNIPNAVAIAVTQRDVFPSGHTMMTLVLMVLSARYKLHSRWLIYTLGTLLIAATVYQRYHYVVDLIAGALFGVLCLMTARPLYRTVSARLHTLEDPSRSTRQHSTPR
jgi:membrane-associated phospholipid phosphatase